MNGYPPGFIAGGYQCCVQVYIRSVGSQAKYEVVKGMGYKLN
jgi:hypothetical protein